jgi:uncharacterized protein YbcI
MSIDLVPRTDPRREISEQVLRVHEDSYGTGAGEVVVHLLDDLVLVMLDKLELSAAEKTLLEGGRAESVEIMRSAFQGAIEPTFSAIVERATGRRVISFMSWTSLAPLYSVELFRLSPAPG